MTKVELTPEDIKEIVLGDHSKFTLVEKKYNYYDDTRETFNFDIVFKTDDSKYFKGKISSLNSMSVQRFIPASDLFKRVYPKKREIEVTEWTIE